jgi:hypothetical protein
MRGEGALEALLHRRRRSRGAWRGRDCREHAPGLPLDSRDPDCRAAGRADAGSAVVRASGPAASRQAPARVHRRVQPRREHVADAVTTAAGHTRTQTVSFACEASSAALDEKRLGADYRREGVERTPQIASAGSVRQGFNGRCWLCPARRCADSPPPTAISANASAQPRRMRFRCARMET